MTLFVPTLSIVSFAQTGRWVQTNGPTGGGVTGIASSGTGVIFISVNGVGVCRSTDGAVSWERRNDGLTSTDAPDILYTRDGTVLVATGSGVFRSGNDAADWSESSTGLTTTEVNSLTQDADGRVFVATWGAGVFVSTNDGLTWSDAGLSGKKLYFIEAGVSGDLFAGTYGEGLFRSTDHGGSWTYLPYPNSYVYGFEETSEGDYFASGHVTGLHRSTDKGQTWEQCSGLDSRGYAYLIHGTASGVVYVGMQQGLVSLHRSTDRGLTWEPCADGISEGNLTDMLITSSGDFFVTHASDGVYRRRNIDASWSRSSNGLRGVAVYDLETLADGTVFAGCNNGIFRSENDGIDWIPSDSGMPCALVQDICVARPGLLFAAAWSYGVFLSSDDGQSWRKLTNGISTSGAQRILRDAAGNIYVGTSQDGVFFSTDEGTTWEQRKGDYPPSASIDMFLTPAGTLLLSTYNAGLQRSVNQGRNYTESGSGLEGNSVWTFSIRGSEIWAATSSGPYRSTNDGLTWSKIPGTPFPDIGIDAIYFPDDMLLFAASGHIVYRSTDGGGSWHALPDGLSDYVNCFTLNAKGEALAGSAASSVYRFLAASSNAEVTVGTNPEGRSYTVDGTTYTSTQTFVWPVGGTHELSTVSSQAGPAGVRYAWSNWSDGGAITHSIVAAEGASTITANFGAEYQLTMGTDGPGSVTPTTGWHAPGAQVQIHAVPGAGQTFLRWDGSGTGSYSGTNNPATVTMNGAITQTARFSGGTTDPEITITSAPPGRRITVDGQEYSGARTFTWSVGSTHEISTTGFQQGAPGVRYQWRSWSNGQPITFTYTVGAGPAVTLTANFDVEYSLTMAAAPGGGISPGTTWHASGTQVQIRATPNAGFAFDRWQGSGPGSYSGTDNPVTLTMGSAITETAYFRQVTGAGGSPAVPHTLVLRQNAPNPCREYTSFEIGLPHPQSVTLVVTDLLGRERARVLDRARLGAGTHVASFDAATLPPGVYLYRLDAESGMRAGRMVVVR